MLLLDQFWPIRTSLHWLVWGIHLVNQRYKTKCYISQWRRNIGREEQWEKECVFLGGLFSFLLSHTLYNSRITPKAALIETQAPAMLIYSDCASFVFGLQTYLDETGPLRHKWGSMAVIHRVLHQQRRCCCSLLLVWGWLSSHWFLTSVLVWNQHTSWSSSSQHDG